jgi:uncharacterized membrane protein
MNFAMLHLFPFCVAHASKTSREQSMHSEFSFWIRWGLAFGITLIIVVLATLPPFVPSAVRATLMMAFSPICHQIPERSPHIDAIALGVCHRCYGVYLGLPVAALAFLVVRRLEVQARTLRYLLFGSLLLLAIDWGAPLIGLWHNTAGTRLVTGLLFGCAAGWYLVGALADTDRQSI